ncbi:MAG: amino acid adenylation domain-containing protein [Methylotetracoccus sp.]
MLERQLAYWRERLTGAPGVLDLPTDRPRPAVQSYRGADCSVSVPASLRADLVRLGRRHDVTLFMSLLAAFGVLLHRISGQHDLCVGTPVANRGRVELEGLIGLFVNTLVMRVDLRGNPPLSEVLRRVRRRSLGAQAHQDLPFEQLVEALQPERSLAHSPLFQVMFNLQQGREERSSELPLLSGSSMMPYEARSGTAMFDLTLDISDDGEALHALLNYNADLFDEDTMAKLARRYVAVLEQLVVDTARPIGTLNLLLPGEVECLRRLGDSALPREFVDTPDLIQAFERQVERSPAAVAVLAGSEALDYETLNRRANRLAHRLMELGLAPGTRVGLLADRTPESIVGLLGVLKAGGAYVPLDPGLPDERLAFQVEDAAAQVIVSGYAAIPPGLAAGVRFVYVDEPPSDDAVTTGGNPQSAMVHPDQAAYVIYTSGTTGQPKGVVVGRAALSRHVAVMARTYALTPEDRVLQFASMAFDVAAEEILPALVSGAGVVLHPPAIFSRTSDFNRFLDDHHVSVVGLSASYWHQWVDEVADGGGDLPRSLRLVIAGNEPVSAERLRRWRSLGERTVDWLNAYGPTEATITSTIFSPARASSDPRSGIVPIGRPIGDRTIRLLDSRGERVPPGSPGELCIGGSELAVGYLGHPGLTAERFVPDPDGDTGARLYRSGDLARWRADGELEFLGRIDHQIKLRGYRIELEEIESVLARIPGVLEAGASIVSPGTTAARLVVHVVLADGVRMDAETVRKHVASRLPGYMVPGGVVFVDELPRMLSGKLDRSALAAMPVADASEPVADERITDTLEQLLAGLWRELLGECPIGRHTDFFALGGHSLLAVRLLAGIRRILGADLSLVAIFRRPTIAGLAELLRGQSRDSGLGALDDLVPLNERTGGAALICFDPTGWHLSSYRALAQSPRIEVPVFGVPAASLLLDDPSPYTSLTDAAEHLAGVIAERFAGQAIALAGWSFGGNIALAVAAALEARSIRPFFVALLDSELAEDPDDDDPVTRFAGYLDAGAERLIEAMTADELATLRVILAQASATGEFAQALSWARERGLIDARRPDAAVELELRLEERRRELWHVYTPKPIAATLLVWLAGEHRRSDFAEYRRFARHELLIETVASDHDSIVSDEAVHAGLAERLGAFISNAG